MHLRVVVTYFDSYIDARRPTLFASDASGGVFISLATKPLIPFKAGELIEVEGISGNGDFAPIVDEARAKSLSMTHLPQKAPRVNMATLLSGAKDGQWVEVEGVVRAVRASDGEAIHADDRNVLLSIALQDGTLNATTLRKDNVDYSQLVDAQILLRGNASPVFNHRGQMTGANMVFPGTQTIVVERPPTKDPFSSPMQQIGKLLVYTPYTHLQQRVHVHGTVMLHWPGRLLCVSDQGHGLCAETEQTSPLHLGDVVDLIGYPKIGEFTPTLSHATFRLANGGTAVAPLPMAPDKVLSTDPDVQLLQIEGKLLGPNEATQDSTIMLSVGDLEFAAVLPGTSGKNLFRGLEKGSHLLLTGVCVMQSDGSGRASGSGFPVSAGFRILLRSPGDVSIVDRPSWWNARHTLMVLAVALVIALAAILRMSWLSEQIKRQTSKILDNQRRFEYLAAHDELTGIFNRRSILNTLSSGLGSQQEHARDICVALVDLDHFKRINDTYGHLAGDVVLRETASRLASTLRATDAVGRYGGEEFLIVFSETDEQAGAERCEIIRQVIGKQPIKFDNASLALSCSIGISSTGEAMGDVTALISRADEALYKAKANGRNRVELYKLATLDPSIKDIHTSDLTGCGATVRDCRA